MSEPIFSQDILDTIHEWQEKINIANQNNIFCHCRNCGEEWVDSNLNAACKTCESNNVERICCWQFPDD
jgi:Zn finger protein HypA/HybF involved in hydrogenase expression